MRASAIRLSTVTLRQLGSIPKSVRIVEVGPRDGLQNEKLPVPTSDKLKLIESLADCGFQTIETTSFVSPKWVPQMGDHLEVTTQVLYLTSCSIHPTPVELVMHHLKRVDGKSYSVLIPNMKGLEAALSVSCTEIAVFGGVSETFTKKNSNATIEQSNVIMGEVIENALKANLKVRGYVSCVLGCPYEGYIKPEAVLKQVSRLLSMGCYEISLGDTIGVGTAGSMNKLLETLLASVPAEKLALHCHDTYGQALANILVGLQHGISVIDSSVSGLGGCPYAPGASGNVASEDLVYMLHGLEIHTGIDLDKLMSISRWISQLLGKDVQAKVTRAKFAT